MSFAEQVVKWVMRRVFSKKTQRFHKIPVRRTYTLPPFFRTTLSYDKVLVVEEEGESPVTYKAMAYIFTFHKPFSKRKLRRFLEESLDMQDWARWWKDGLEITEGFEEEQISKDEIHKRFYYAVFTLDDEEVREENLH